MSALLCIGGIDSSGGAGVLRDCATAAAFGVPARVAVTAVTAQSDRAVRAVELCAPEVIGAQIAAAFEQGEVAAVKVGMLGGAAQLGAVAAALPERVPLVLDPVLVASSGARLLDAAGLVALLDFLPRITLLTPNLPERAQLAEALGVAPESATAALLDRGVGAVLVKGGHGAGAQAVDRLVTAEGAQLFTAPRRAGQRRGTGCSLASAIACGLVLGQGLAEACAAAKAHVQARFD